LIPGNLRGNLRVLPQGKTALVLCLLLVAAVSAGAQDGGAEARRPRWFRSNAGGMALQETATRLAAMGNEYALLVDYAAPSALPEQVRPFYRDRYYIEVRVLYRRGEESRRQWIFRDAQGVTRLVSVLNRPTADPRPAETAAQQQEDGAAADGGSGTAESASDAPTGRAPWGFIELYNENNRITEEYMFSDDGTETVVAYTYRGGLLIRAEGRRKPAAEETGEAEGNEKKEAVKTFTDEYRYNRSSSLRLVERLYHEAAEALPVRLTFPNRVLDLARETGFGNERLVWNTEFFGEYEVKPGYRMVFTTDERGRILTQTLLDTRDEAVWLIQNTWSGNRLASALKTEGEDRRLIEYEYDGGGERIIERNLHNGVLERLVRAEGGRDVEELYMDDEVILRAIWEDGRKTSEERIRRRQGE
jgi:hypothetical protein